ncbi:MAG: hypothetical protein FE042_00525 [Thermoplasmata archaeon]|nr:MAG: hypothetical protein FE042_00525 [Thermoplasmata archaeon]
MLVSGTCKFVIIYILSAAMTLSGFYQTPGFCCERDIPFYGEILFVGGHGNNNYTSIQEAIENASCGDTIFVYSGTYYENVVVNKPIKLMGESKLLTIIDAGQRGDGIRIEADSVVIYNFTVRNTGTGNSAEYIENAAVKIAQSDNILVKNVICYDTNYGVWADLSKHGTITNCTIHGFYDGIALYRCRGFTLRNNTLVTSSITVGGFSLTELIHDIDISNTVNGKPVYYYVNCSGTTVPGDAGEVILVNCSNFTISHLNISGGTVGIDLMFSNNNTISNNIIRGMTDFGISLHESDGNIIENNSISCCPFGISFRNVSAIFKEGFKTKANCEHNIVRYNSINCCSYVGLIIIGSNNNIISHNDFIRNNIDARFIMSYGNKWERNYWDEWVGLKYPILDFLPKIIWGSQIRWLWWSNIWTNFDWHPALKPYHTWCNSG